MNGSEGNSDRIYDSCFVTEFVFSEVSTLFYISDCFGRLIN